MTKEIISIQIAACVIIFVRFYRLLKSDFLTRKRVVDSDMESSGSGSGSGPSKPKKKQAKQPKETLMDHLNKVKDGNASDSDDSAESDVDMEKRPLDSGKVLPLDPDELHKERLLADSSSDSGKTTKKMNNLTSEYKKNAQLIYLARGRLQRSRTRRQRGNQLQKEGKERAKREATKRG